MAEGVEGDAKVFETTIKTDEDHIVKAPEDDRIGILLNNELMSDIKFAVNGKKFHAHKFVLSYASEVFCAMFNGPLADDKKEVKIVDCEKPDDFLEFLSLIYKKSAKVTWENVNQLSYLRKKYMLMETRPFSTFIKSIINIDNCLDALDISATLEEDVMVEECLNVIRRDITVLVITKRFLELKQPALKAILKQDMLNINEFDLFLAVDKWCTYQVKLKISNGEKMTKREIIGDALYHIRFPLIKIEAFTRYCRSSKMLTNKEIVSLYDTIVMRPSPLDFEAKSCNNSDGDSSENKGRADKLAARFISKPRVKGNTIVHLMEDENLYARSATQRNKAVNSRSYPTHNALTIMVNKKAWLIALKIIGPWIHIDVPSRSGSSFVCSEDGLAWLAEPLCMEASTKYSITCENIYPPNGYCRQSYGERIPTEYEWNDFKCTIYQPWGRWVAPISQLVFSIFSSTAMSHFDIPLLTMEAKKRSVDVDPIKDSK